MCVKHVCCHIHKYFYIFRERERVGSEGLKDIGGSPLSNFVEVLANTSKSAVTMSTRWVVNIPATKPLSVSCHCT